MLKIHVLVTTYEALIKDYEEIAEIPWRTIVVDEAHRLRNWRGRPASPPSTSVTVD